MQDSISRLEPMMGASLGQRSGTIYLGMMTETRIELSRNIHLSAIGGELSHRECSATQAMFVSLVMGFVGEANWAVTFQTDDLLPKYRASSQGICMLGCWPTLCRLQKDDPRRQDVTGRASQARQGDRQVSLSLRGYELHAL